ncbi:hypothetical protein RJ55_01275 [Drechmeria coniospora]|nr:hypothetical protein RJ55_01275 [Drechmeria coniospora]
MVMDSLPSAISTPVSFYTANDSDAQHESTTASSPVQDASCPYRATRQLPRELKEHCQIFLEEQLYMCAINLLSSVLGTGVSRAPGGRCKPALAPPPSHLALLSTLIVHPTHTTRADKPEHLDISSLALGYLRNLLALAGPINAGFRAAFQYGSTPRWAGRRHADAGHGSDSDMSDADDRDHDRLRGRMANEASLWTRGRDLWSTVGWAFNTATLHPHRWRYWRLWLEYMLDVLEADWNERERIDLEAFGVEDGPKRQPRSSRQESMIVMYMDQQENRQAGFKRILKALFADGESPSSSSFPEVFEKEHRGLKKTTRKRKRDLVLDVENDKFGDYFDDDSISSGVSEPPTPQKPLDARKEASFVCSNPGLAESVTLRLRFFALLSAATFALRKRSELNQLYESFAAASKVLPLPLFSLFVSPRDNSLLPETRVTLIKELFHLLLPSSFKSPRKVDPEGDAVGSLTMPMLEHCYIALPANTVGLEDNAKLSLLVESAMQLLWSCDMLEYTDSFAEAASEGTRAREAKARKKRTGKMRVADTADIIAQDTLTNSGRRIAVFLEALKATTG